MKSVSFYLVLSFIFIATHVALIPLESQTTKEEFVFFYDALDRDYDLNVGTMDIEGNIQKLNLEHSDGLSIAPNGTTISLIHEESLRLVTANGELINEYQLDYQNDASSQCKEWVIWGMIDSHTVVVLHCLLNELTFYKVEFTLPNVHITEMPYLNHFVEKVSPHLAQFDHPGQAYPLMLFNQTFTYIVTRLSPNPNEKDEYLIGDYAYVYDLTSASTPLVNVLDGIHPWWDVNTYQPQWSSNDRFFYPVFDGSTLDLFVFTPDTAESMIVFDATCDGCWGAIQIQISPSSEQIAFLYDENTWQLIFLNLDVNEIHKIDDIPMKPRFMSWTPSGDYLALQTENQMAIIDIKSNFEIQYYAFDNYDFTALIGAIVQTAP